jgi:hypothetical protein
LSELDHIKRKVPAARQKPAENTCTSSHQAECQSTSCNGERTEDIVNRLMNHQIETTSALNQLTKECQSLREKLDQAHNRLDLQQRQIDLLTDPNPRHHQASQPYLQLTSQSLHNSLTARSFFFFFLLGYIYIYLRLTSGLSHIPANQKLNKQL